MRGTLSLRGQRNPEVSSTIDALRADTLLLFLSVVTVGYLGWQIGVTLLRPVEEVPRYWVLFPVAAPGLATAYLLSRLESRLAAPCLIATLVAMTTVAVWTLDSTPALFLYPLAVLASVALMHPLVGLVVSLGSSLLLLALWSLYPPPSLSEALVFGTSGAMVLTVLAAWTLWRSTAVTVGWWLRSYEQALENTKAAQDHRAQLVKALKQLDHAYYQLQQANASLEMAWKSAESAERAKTELATHISHELRTPLNLIVGFSEMMLTAPESYGVHLPAAYRLDLRALHRSAEHLLTLTNDVIDLASVNTGRLALSREPVDIGAVIGDACAIVRDYLTAKGLSLEVLTELAPPTLHVDRLRIRQALLNLLTNAVRFTEHGGLTVSLSLDAGDRVVVKVTDTGRGIPPSELPHVFDEFHHGSEDSVPERSSLGGFGLGLPISKRFIELHGGEMGVESTVGVGTTFWFTLPVSQGDSPSHLDGWRPSRLPRGAVSAERALVIAGGDPRLAQLLQRYVSGFQIVSAPQPQRAISLACELNALGILLDSDVADSHSSQASPVPVLRLTLPHKARMASALGATDYLVKPVTRAELRAAIARLKRPIRTILVVDDDPDYIHLMRRLLASLFQAQEVEILCAQDGQSALDLMKARRPDLLLVDLLLPGLGGEQIIAAVRSDHSLQDLPIIVVSARGEIEGQFPLQGPLTLTTPEGLRFDELLEIVEAIFKALRPVPHIQRERSGGPIRGTSRDSKALRPQPASDGRSASEGRHRRQER